MDLQQAFDSIDKALQARNERKAVMILSNITSKKLKAFSTDKIRSLVELAYRKNCRFFLNTFLEKLPAVAILELIMRLYAKKQNITLEKLLNDLQVRQRGKLENALKLKFKEVPCAYHLLANFDAKIFKLLQKINHEPFFSQDVAYELNPIIFSLNKGNSEAAIYLYKRGIDIGNCNAIEFREDAIINFIKHILKNYLSKQDQKLQYNKKHGTTLQAFYNHKNLQGVIIKEILKHIVSLECTLSEINDIFQFLEKESINVNDSKSIVLEIAFEEKLLADYVLAHKESYKDVIYEERNLWHLAIRQEDIKTAVAGLDKKNVKSDIFYKLLSFYEHDFVLELCVKLLAAHQVQEIKIKSLLSSNKDKVPITISNLLITEKGDLLLAKAIEENKIAEVKFLLNVSTKFYSVPQPDRLYYFSDKSLINLAKSKLLKELWQQSDIFRLAKIITTHPIPTDCHNLAKYKVLLEIIHQHNLSAQVLAKIFTQEFLVVLLKSADEDMFQQLLTIFVVGFQQTEQDVFKSKLEKSCWQHCSLELIISLAKRNFLAFDNKLSRASYKTTSDATHPTLARFNLACKGRHDIINTWPKKDRSQLFWLVDDNGKSIVRHLIERADEDCLLELYKSNRGSEPRESKPEDANSLWNIEPRLDYRFAKRNTILHEIIEYSRKDGLKLFSGIIDRCIDMHGISKDIMSDFKPNRIKEFLSKKNTADLTVVQYALHHKKFDILQYAIHLIQKHKLILKDFLSDVEIQNIPEDIARKVMGNVKAETEQASLPSGMASLLALKPEEQEEPASEKSADEMDAKTIVPSSSGIKHAREENDANAEPSKKMKTSNEVAGLRGVPGDLFAAPSVIFRPKQQDATKPNRLRATNTPAPPPISEEEAQEIGKAAEETYYLSLKRWYAKKYSGCEIKEQDDKAGFEVKAEKRTLQIKWLKEEKYADHDFEIIRRGDKNDTRHVEIKGSKKEGAATFFVSHNELMDMQKYGEKSRLFLIANVGKSTPSFHYLKDPIKEIFPGSDKPEAQIRRTEKIQIKAREINWLSPPEKKFKPN